MKIRRRNFLGMLFAAPVAAKVVAAAPIKKSIASSGWSDARVVNCGDVIDAKRFNLALGELWTSGDLIGIDHLGRCTNKWKRMHNIIGVYLGHEKIMLEPKPINYNYSNITE